MFFFGKGISPWKNLRLSGCRIETALQTSTVDFYSHLGWGWEVSQLIFFCDAYLMSLTVVLYSFEMAKEMIARSIWYPLSMNRSDQGQLRGITEAGGVIGRSLAEG